MPNLRKSGEEILTRLIEMIYEKPGMYLNYDELSEELKISKKTLLQHMYYLEFAYIIRKIKNYRPGVRIASRKLQRAYPFHWSLGFGWTGNINFETVVSSFLTQNITGERMKKKWISLLLTKKFCQ